MQNITKKGKNRREQEERNEIKARENVQDTLEGQRKGEI